MSQPVKISVVEDDAIFSRILKVRLTGLGYEVVSHADAHRSATQAWTCALSMSSDLPV